MLFVLITGCKSKNRAVTANKLNTKLSAKQIIKTHEAAKANFKTLQSKIKIDYKDKTQDLGYTVSLRLQKDKVIWLNAAVFGATVARAKITPTRVGFYKRFPNQYFDGDFSLISKFLGTELDYTKLQNLLLGDAIYNLSGNKYTTSVLNNAYSLQPKKQSKLFELLLLIHPNHFKMAATQIQQAKENRLLEIKYDAYQQIEQQYFPKDITITASEGEDALSIQMQLKSVTLNEDLRFPFKIPSGFEEIVIE